MTGGNVAFTIARLELVTLVSAPAGPGTSQRSGMAPVGTVQAEGSAMPRKR